MHESQVVQTAASVGVELSAAQAAQFTRYYALLVEWNARFNLTAITDEEGVLLRHIADSLTALRCFPQGARSVLDLGTGAGFPGIPLKIARPSLAVVLMDSTHKKVVFCDEVLRALDLRDIRAVHARAEEAAREVQDGRALHRERYDVAIARAVAPMPTLIEYLMPFVRVGGVGIAMKGSDARAEVGQAHAAIKSLGGALDGIEEVTLPGLPDQRALIVVRKIAPSPTKYPRPGGKPRSKPIQE